ncbi:unnamed protein product [Discosporangium mesarthrocarpum]
MVDMYTSLLGHQAWDLVPPPPARKIVDSKWVYKVKSKREVQGSIWGSRLIPPGADFFSTPVARITSIRIIPTIATHQDWNRIHLDVKTAFIQSDVEDEIYIKHAKGLIKTNSTDTPFVARLGRACTGSSSRPRTGTEPFILLWFI